MFFFVLVEMFKSLNKVNKTKIQMKKRSRRTLFCMRDFIDLYWSKAKQD